MLGTNESFADLVNFLGKCLDLSVYWMHALGGVAAEWIILC
jgi:hypothetical protein